jgi:hypothetical protein
MAKAVTLKDSWIAAQFLKGAPAGCEKQGEDGNLGGGRGGPSDNKVLYITK